MRFPAPFVLATVPLWFMACATAEDSSIPNFPGGSSGKAFAGSPGFSGSPSTLPSGGARPAEGGSNSQAGSFAQSGSPAVGSAGSPAAAGGTGGSAGTGGGAGAPTIESGVCSAMPIMTLQYKQSGGNAKQISAELAIGTTSDTPIALSSLKIRYFFSNENSSGWKPMIYNAQLDGGTGGYRSITGATLTVVPLGMKLSQADTYAEFSFPAAAGAIEKGAKLGINWDMQPNSYNPPSQDQANDFSFNPAASVFTAWDHIAIYQGSTLIFGCAPAAQDNGGAGAGGVGGGAGIGGSAGAGVGGSAGSSVGGRPGSSGAGSSGAGASGAGASGSAGVGGSSGASAGSGAAAGASGSSGSAGVGGAQGGTGLI